MSPERTFLRLATPVLHKLQSAIMQRPLSGRVVAQVSEDGFGSYANLPESLAQGGSGVSSFAFQCDNFDARFDAGQFQLEFQSLGLACSEHCLVRMERNPGFVTSNMARPTGKPVRKYKPASFDMALRFSPVSG